MLLYLDTRDLIQVLERGHPLEIDELSERLAVGRHEVVVSYSNVRELVQPLFEPKASTIVTRLLNQLERLPLRYVREAGISQQELLEAFGALSAGREYAAVSPFVRRFDEVCTPLGQIPVTANFVNFSIAEAVFMIFRSDPAALRQPQRHLDALRFLLEADRKLGVAPSLRDHFAAVVARNNNQWRLGIPEDRVQALADWVYDNPTRCPGMRISYEIYHALRTNQTDAPKEGDILDITHATLLPYVDLATLDSRMRDYIRRVAARIRSDCPSKVCEDASDLLARVL